MKRILAITLALLLAPASAAATYSIAATDTITRAAGSAGASCVPYEVILIYGVAPDRGAVDAQAHFDLPSRDEAVSLLGQGAPPDEILAAITNPSTHAVAPKMQYGIVDTLGRAAGYTGPEALAFAGHRTGALGQYAYSIQGNILTSEKVIDQAEAAFLSSGCDLADKLMVALEAGAANGEGDSRCTPEGRPSNSAFIDVTLPHRVSLHISLPDVSPKDPIQELRAAFDDWRAENPCPSPSGGVDGGGGASASSGPSETAAGCSCGVSGSGGGGAVWVAPILFFLAGRRHRALPRG